MIAEGFVTDPKLLAEKARELDLPTERALAREVCDELGRRIGELNAEQPACVGLAAPQIGAPVRVCVLQFFQPPLLNPRIHEAVAETRLMGEGCFSLPGSYGDEPALVTVARSVHVQVRYQTFKGEWRETSFRGFEARAVQHELDHLDGLLITDRAARL